MRGKEPRVPNVVLIGDYLAGDTLREIGARYGVSFQSLAIQLKNAGYEPRPKNSNRRKYADRICERCGVMFRPRQPRQPRQRFCSRACMRGPRQATCKRGHPLTEDNLRPRYGKAPRRCIACEKAAQARYRAKKTLLAPTGAAD